MPAFSSFSIHFDGPITIDHKVSIRVLSKTYGNMQRAIDRAFLIEHYGNVWKHARLTDKQYAETEFIANYPREGGIILDAVKRNAGKIIDRIANSIIPVYDEVINQGLKEFKDISNQYIDRTNYAASMQENVPRFEDVLKNPPSGWADAYSNRSVVKEIDQLVNQISPERLVGSTVDVSLFGSRSYLPFKFDAGKAKQFHNIASRRDLGSVFIVRAVIRSLDRGNKYTKPNSKILNIATDREVSLRLQSVEDCDKLHKFHNGEPIEIFACPIIEALGFDVNGGDLMFIDVV